MPAVKVYAQQDLDLGNAKVIKQGGVVATVDTDLPLEKLVNLLYAGQAAPSEPVKAEPVAAKVEAAKPVESKPKP